MITLNCLDDQSLSAAPMKASKLGAKAVPSLREFQSPTTQLGKKFVCGLVLACLQYSFIMCPLVLVDWSSSSKFCCKDWMCSIFFTPWWHLLPTLALIGEGWWFSNHWHTGSFYFWQIVGHHWCKCWRTLDQGSFPMGLHFPPECYLSKIPDFSSIKLYALASIFQECHHPLNSLLDLPNCDSFCL